MNREIEMKLPLTQDQYQSLFEKIQEPPFTKPIHLIKSDTYFSRYDTPDERKQACKENKEPRVIRIRTDECTGQEAPDTQNKSQKKSYFCIKNKSVQNGIEFNDEHESLIEDPEVLKLFFKVAGYKEYFHKSKDAYSTHYKDFHLELEKVNGLPYVEIEVTTSTLPADTVRQNIEDFVKELGLDPKTRDSRSWMEIITGI